MSRLARGFCLSLTVLALAASPATAQESVAGTWMFTMNAPQGVVNMTVVFAQHGTEVTGSAELELDFPMATEISDGLFEDGTLSFLLHVGVEDQWFTVEMEAEVDGDEMTGEAYLPEMGASSFTAKRSEGG